MPCPFNWEHASLGDIIDLRTGPFGSALHRSDYAFGEVPLINPMHITAGRIAANPDHCVSEDTAKRLSEYRLLKGDIVMGRRGEMGRCAVVGPPYVGSVCGTGSLILRRTDGIYPPFLQYFLSSDQVVSYLQSAAVGSTMANLNQKLLLGISIDIPPTTEQVRIVEKLEELLSDLDAGVAELKAAQKKLALYRQSLLKAAVEGALTAGWRAARGEPHETGADLLARILTERRARWEARQLAKFEEQGKMPPKGWQARYPDTTPPDTQHWPELPPEWTWTRVSVAGRVQLGRQRSPQFHSGENMVPYLRVANVFEERIDVSDVMAMHFSKADESTYRLEPKDILLNEGQSLDLVGRPAMYRGELERACFTNTLVRFQAASGVVPEFALLVFLHYMHSGRFRKIAKITTNIAHLGAERFSDLPFPLPPIDEQMQIVSSYASIIENVEAQRREIELSLKRATAQRKNLLKAAFSGQLVPQDPNDEPASALLARIRAEREMRGNSDPAQRRRKTTHA